MSGVGLKLRYLWSKDPVVSTSLAMAAIGIILPLTVPRFWGKYPDQIAEDARVEREKQAYLESRKRQDSDFW